jgi:pyruvate kinase
MIVLITKNAESEVVRIRNIDAVMMSEETISGYRPVGFRVV